MFSTTLLTCNALKLTHSLTLPTHSVPTPEMRPTPDCGWPILCLHLKSYRLQIADDPFCAHIWKATDSRLRMTLSVPTSEMRQTPDCLWTFLCPRLKGDRLQIAYEPFCAHTWKATDSRLLMNLSVPTPERRQTLSCGWPRQWARRMAGRCPRGRMSPGWCTAASPPSAPRSSPQTRPSPSPSCRPWSVNERQYKRCLQ